MATANVFQDPENRKKTKFLKELGGHIKALRMANELTAAEMGRRLGMERSHVSRLESGGTNPSAFLIYKICVVLKISLAEFWDRFKKISSE